MAQVSLPAVSQDALRTMMYLSQAQQCLTKATAQFNNIKQRTDKVHKEALELEKAVDVAANTLLLSIHDTPRHYAMRKYSCWYRACSRVRGRGPKNGIVSRGTYLDVINCACNNLTAWREDHFTVTKTVGIEE